MNWELANAVSNGLNRMRGGDRAAFFQSVLLPQDATALDLFPGWGILECWHAFYVHCGIQPPAGDGGLMKMTIGRGKHHLCEDSRTVWESSAYGNKVGAPTSVSIASPLHIPPHLRCPLLPPPLSLCSVLSSFAWILSIADFNSASN